MLRFLDGPAGGVTVDCRRAPVFLRVVRSDCCSGTTAVWDALDQPDDKPARKETIHVYRLSSIPYQYHVCRSPRSRSGWSVGADYNYVGEIDEKFTRDNAAWVKWAENRARACNALASLRELKGFSATMFEIS